MPFLWLICLTSLLKMTEKQIITKQKTLFEHGEHLDHQHAVYYSGNFSSEYCYTKGRSTSIPATFMACFIDSNKTYETCQVQWYNNGMQFNYLNLPNWTLPSSNLEAKSIVTDLFLSSFKAKIILQAFYVPFLKHFVFHLTNACIAHNYMVSKN